MDLAGVERLHAPSARRTSSAPASSIPAPMPSPPAQRTGRSRSASRARSAARQSAAGSASRRAEQREQLVSVASSAAGGRPSVAARARTSGGSAATSTATLTPMPSTAHSRRTGLDQHPGQLPSPEEHVVRPLHDRRFAGEIGHRQARPQRQQRIPRAQQQRQQQRAPRRRRPHPPLPPPPGALRAAVTSVPCGAPAASASARASVVRRRRCSLAQMERAAYRASSTNSAETRPSGVCGSASRSGSSPASLKAAVVAGPIEATRGPSNATRPPRGRTAPSTPT